MKIVALETFSHIYSTKLLFEDLQNSFHCNILQKQEMDLKYEVYFISSKLMSVNNTDFFQKW